VEASGVVDFGKHLRFYGRNSAGKYPLAFVVIARRWVVKRSLAWWSRNRRLAKEYEHLAASSTLLLYLAAVHLRLKRLAPDPTAPIPHARARPGQSASLLAKALSRASEAVHANPRS
jgi:Transposase DDE domain